MFSLVSFLTFLPPLPKQIYERGRGEALPLSGRQQPHQVINKKKATFTSGKKIKKWQELERQIIHMFTRREDQSKKVKSEEGILDNRKSMVWIFAFHFIQLEYEKLTSRVILILILVDILTLYNEFVDILQYRQC